MGNLATKLGPAMIALGLSGVVGSAVEAFYDYYQVANLLTKDKEAAQMYAERAQNLIYAGGISMLLTTAGFVGIATGLNSSEKAKEYKEK